MEGVKSVKEVMSPLSGIAFLTTGHRLSEFFQTCFSFFVQANKRTSEQAYKRTSSPRPLSCLRVRVFCTWLFVCTVFGELSPVDYYYYT